MRTYIPLDGELVELSEYVTLIALRTKEDRRELLRNKEIENYAQKNSVRLQTE